MSGVAYFFKPKISSNDSGSSSSTTTNEKRPGRRSKAVKSSETTEKTIQPMETEAPPPPPLPPPSIPETNTIPSEQTETPPIQTPKIKLKFNLRSQSVQDTSDDRIITNITNETNNLSDGEDDNDDDDESDNETRLKIDDNHGNFDEQDLSPLPIKHDETPTIITSPTKKKQSSSRKKVLSHLIGTTSNTLSIDEPSPIKILPNESQFSEVKQTKIRSNN